MTKHNCIKEILEFNPKELSEIKQEVFGRYFKTVKGCKLWIKKELYKTTELQLNNVLLILRNKEVSL
ncbi:MAG: hypothetical protein A2Z57_03335 [Planctomycetes bacterium RIFCSPHIGHO2_12_39_6]|nr:MAG: hypothetical protein A2Z57_03335 [Planctomycetes bacterium RIFCSPHIGHO2_12_39_6]